MGSVDAAGPAAAGGAARTVLLKSGTHLPLLGFGTHQMQGEGCDVAVRTALDAGHGLIDTGSIYKNEEDVGRAVAVWEEAQKQAGNDQARAFIETKCSPYEMGTEKAARALENSLQRLGKESVDLYLIHWPGVPKKPHKADIHRRVRHETWRALETAYKAGKARAIGVSNFNRQHLEALMEDGVEIMPMVNQIEVHPLFVPLEIIEFCQKNDIIIQAYSPLAAGPTSNAAKDSGGQLNGTKTLLGHPVVVSISEELGRTPAQVCLRWAIEMGFAIVPRSTSAPHIQENAAIFDFELSPAHMERMAQLREDPDARKFCWDSAGVV
eukprot:TRINITY_DN28188_c0_g1_i1.p1 TRINITY_DN28188_c0_g1~~TRINITY_DN28188_c0_g1_i1.p1  ORF type:complete len:324 (+),score=67.45 TRINITY_DN28188_c0_g1_i1:113-1084(+)